MGKVNKQVSVRVDKDQAFKKFVHQFNEWWPKEYTWSRESLSEIRMDPRENGLCSEFGPCGFRCDWGRITTIEPGGLTLKWQIGPDRVPEPNPDKASVIHIRFVAHSPDETIVTLEHTDFQNHGEGAETYRKAMEAEYGWEYILAKFVTYCEKKAK